MECDTESLYTSFLNLTMSDNVGNNWTGGVQEEVSNEQQMGEQCKQANVLQGEDIQPSNDGVSAPAKKREKNEESTDVNFCCPHTLYGLLAAAPQWRFGSFEKERPDFALLEEKMCIKDGPSNNQRRRPMGHAFQDQDDFRPAQLCRRLRMSKPAATKIFVGGISWDTNENDLTNHFNQFGDVVHVQVKYDHYTGRSRGFAFVEFATAEACKKALAKKDAELKGKKCEVKPAKSRENKKLFVGGLPSDYTEELLRKHMEQFGRVEEIEWPFDKVNNKRKNFAFIVFEDDDGAAAAAALPKQRFGDRTCDVKIAVPQYMRPQKTAGPGMSQQWPGHYHDYSGYSGYGSNAGHYGYFDDFYGGGSEYGVGNEYCTYPNYDNWSYGTPTAAHAAAGGPPAAGHMGAPAAGMPPSAGRGVRGGNYGGYAGYGEIERFKNATRTRTMKRFWIWFVFFLIPAFVQCSILLWNVDRNDDLELNDIFDSKNGRGQFFLFLLPEFSMAQLSQQFGAYDTEEKCTNLVHFKKLVKSSKGYQLMNSHLGSRILNDSSTALFAQKDALNVDNWKNMNRVILKLTSWEDLELISKKLVEQNVGNRIGLLSTTAIFREKRNAKLLANSKAIPTETFVNVSGNCFLYASKILFVIRENTYSTSKVTNVELPASNLKSTGKCNNYAGSMDLKWSPFVTADQKSFSDFTLSFHFDQSPGWWFLNNITLTASGSAISEKSLQYVFNETAVHSLRLNGANGFAYACRKPRALMIPTSQEAKFQYGIAFLKLQVQPFRAARTNGFTDNIDDCTPFFTAEVWMSLISVFVIFAITIFGVSMISGLKTMDRFDDPKGKSLVINFKE
ncbi:RNA-binding protein squid [Trichinella murrelli]|uniref:RNA-binding protein squid n=1 Tax=Trichinella murrelli TaxID=144512 RepID=A0A0V0U0V9_9BILA|nr:RNA-binding protein squid [Trichinella murrelli]